jgi:glycosyltransferase involved in cell wall biosynthesis
MDKKPSISVVVPVYNSASTLRELSLRLENILKLRASTFELILVDDASQDTSWEIIQQLAEENPWIHGIRLMRNYGQHNALLCGIRASQHKIIITMDDDLQHPPEEIPALLEELASGSDVVYGTPQKLQHGFWRNLTSWLTKFVLQSIMGAETARKVSAFRIFRTQVREAFFNYHSPFVSIDVLLTWGTTNFSAVPVHHDLRRAGVSHYTFRKLIVHALNMITGFSTVPLQLASLLGFTFTLFGLGVLLYVVGRYLILGWSVPGFPFLASIIAILSGVQLFVLGIIGEHLARIQFRIVERPTYLVRSTTKSKRS